MNVYLAPGVLAQPSWERLRGLNDYMNQARDPWTGVSIWLAALAVTVAVLVAMSRRSRRAAGDGPGPWGLFFRLVLKAPLTWGQRCTLYRLARSINPACPAAVLLTPSALAATAAAWAEKRGQSPEQLLAGPLAPVGQTLFGQPLPAPAEKG